MLLWTEGLTVAHSLERLSNLNDLTKKQMVQKDVENNR
jgi:hypothetical protein